MSRSLSRYRGLSRPRSPRPCACGSVVVTFKDNSSFAGQWIDSEIKVCVCVCARARLFGNGQINVSRVRHPAPALPVPCPPPGRAWG